jgi:integrase/recombinase XerD
LPTQIANDKGRYHSVARSHFIAWRKHLESRELTPSSIRRKLSAIASLFDYLCEHNAVLGNPVDGVKRPPANSNEGSTPALGEHKLGDCWRPLPRIR